MTIDLLLKLLTEYKKAYGGDKKVVMSSDPEGNSFAALDNTPDVNKNWSLSYVKDGAGKVIGVCLWPFVENLSTDEEACQAK